ncbi:hypothetical protein OQA88_9693 [Cercophora sp. LCS_1]
MPSFTTRDGTSIYYKDWGNKSGPVVTFSHGWPLNADNWDSQAFFLASKGYRVIAHDRRGHGRSDQPWEGNNMDTYADDLHELFKHLDLRDTVMVGHSTGGGEVARFVGRHGTDRVKKAVLIGAVPPIMVQSESNPEGTPLAVFDSFRESILKDRSQFFYDVPSGPFFNFNLPGATVSKGLIESWWQQGMQAGFKGAYDCVKQFSETDFTEDLKKMNIPVLVLHGDADQIVPIKASALKTINLLPQGTLKVYPGGAHALPNLEADKVNADLLEFIEA